MTNVINADVLAGAGWLTKTGAGCCLRYYDCRGTETRIFFEVAHSASHLLPHNQVMRFIHSGDWQIGMRAVHAGDAAKIVRAARLTTAERICHLASKEAVDFLLLTGDTFEDNAVDRELVEHVAALLASTPCPVYVLPGNHDPIQPGCVWEHPVWRSAGNVTVLSEPTPVPVAGGVLLPCPLRTRRSPEDPTAWIPAGGKAGEIRVVVAHGNAGDIMAEDGGFPIPLDTPARTAADYVALGHWHSTALFGNRMAYCGTPETTRFGETDSGNVLVVSIAGPGAVPEIRKERTGQLRWCQVGIGETITSPGRLAEIARQLAQTPDQDKAMVEVILTGLLFEVDQDELARIEKTCARYLHARIDRSALRPAPDDHDWIDHLPTGVARMSAERLKTATSMRGAEAEIATQALLELYAFAQEVRS
jgi:DNA repair exonuclease SbcCD nuclease subunit